MSRPHLVVFDCDGTIVDSQHMIIEAMRRAFADHRLSLPADSAVRRIVGLSLPQAIASLLPDQPHTTCLAVAESYKTAFTDLRHDPAAHQEVLYDGALEAIAALAGAGFLLGVATGKSRRGLDGIIERFELGRYFITLQTADAHPSKPDPTMLHAAISEAGTAPSATIVIGDTRYDMDMARAAGAMALGVDWGYHDPDELNAAGARQVLGHFDEVPAAVARLFAHEEEKP